MSQKYWPLYEIVLARLKEFIREPAAVFWVYVFPLLMVAALGIAFRNQPVEQITVDLAAGAQAEKIMKLVEGDPRVKLNIFSYEECKARLRTGRTDLVIIPKESEDTVEYQYDFTRSESVAARDKIDMILQVAAGREDVITAADVPFEEPGGRYIDFLVPGLLGMNLMGGGLWGVGFAIVNLRIKNLLKRMLATPMRRADFLFGMMISRIIFMLPEVFVLVIFAWYFFGVVIYGSYFVLAVLMLLGALEFAGIGLLVASRAETIETVSGLMNLVMLPLWIFGGIFFSTERFPAMVQPLIQMLPLVPLNNALRKVMLEGGGFGDVWFEILIMSLWTVVTFSIALLIFKWK